MFEWIAGVTGIYNRQLMILSFTQVQFLLSGLIMALPYQKKKRLPLRLLFCFLLWMALLWGAVILRTHVPSMATRIPVHILNLSLTLPMLFICLDENQFTVLNVWCAGLAAEEIGAVLYEFLMSAFGFDTSKSLSFFGYVSFELDILVFQLIHLLIYLAVYFLLGRRNKAMEDPRSLKQLTWLVVVSVLLISGLSAFSSEFRSQSPVLFIVTRVYSLALALVILLIRSGIIHQGQARAEIAVMEQVMAQERKQYEQNRENIYLINMRCHDLKHQLANLAGKLTNEEVKSLQEAMNIYDSTIKTGNEVLDVVLYENQLTCEKEHIQLSCMANGKALSFMRTRHIYALFSNALRNAMEAVRKVENPEQRIISIHVEDVGEQVEITVINYYAGEISTSDGQMMTSKTDINHHGFGTMSMRHITDQYHGRMGVEARNGIFKLFISLPKPAETAA